MTFRGRRALTVGLLLAGVALLARVLLLRGRVALRGRRALVGLLLLAVLGASCGREKGTESVLKELSSKLQSQQHKNEIKCHTDFLKLTKQRKNSNQTEGFRPNTLQLKPICKVQLQHSQRLCIRALH